LLCFYSDFFRAAFEGSFKEATEGKVELSDVTVDTFEAFQVWLYSQSLRNIEDPQDSSTPSALPDFATLARLWVFGDKYQIPYLQNCIIDAMIKKEEEVRKFSGVVVRIAYENTMDGSSLRRFAIDMCVFRMVHEVAENSIFASDWDKHCNQHALKDFARCLSHAWECNLPKSVMPERPKCHYHVHADGEQC
jgi:hypothetical protein